MKPMLCQPSPPFSSDEFLFEPKLDGVRCIALVKDGKIKLQSRSGSDMTAQFPEISLPSGDMVLDGEIVCLDDNGVPSFNHIQHRIHRTNHIQIGYARRVYPVIYFAFDILERDGRDLKPLPLRERKTILSSVLHSGLDSRAVPFIIGDGEIFFRALTERGFEGVVGKHLGSPYLPDTRSPLWRKVKGRKEGVFYVCGVTKGEGNREGLIGSLILGEETDRGLVFVGEVGSGLTFDDLGTLPKLLAEGECPFDPKPKVEGFWYWTVPQIQAEVEYFERGDKLRHPSLKRILR